MARVSSNSDAIADLIDALVDSIDFTTVGANGSLAEDLVDVIATGIADRSAQGLDPDGHPWDANEDKYAAYKRKKYDVDRPGELGGQMLSLESLKGRPAISAEKVEMAYGTGEVPPPNARNGAALTDSQRAVTDRDKAGYFTDSGRRFYEFDDAIKTAALDVASQFVADQITIHWG